MASVRGLGVNPNAGVYGLVQQYMALERTEINRLQEMKQADQTRRTAFTDLGAKLRDLRSAADDFRWGGSLSPINSFDAQSSNTDVVSVSAASGAGDGIHTL